MLAVLEEAKLVVGFWLRAGNTACANNVVAFTLELLANLPKHIRLRLARVPQKCSAREILFREG
ncbi:MAG: hypothetical protein WCP06_09825, partial [Verrucomicrobiota bacterium]